VLSWTISLSNYHLSWVQLFPLASSITLVTVGCGLPLQVCLHLHSVELITIIMHREVRNLMAFDMPSQV
jgi:hypothetical protein